MQRAGKQAGGAGGREHGEHGGGSRRREYWNEPITLVTLHGCVEAGRASKQAGSERKRERATSRGAGSREARV